MGLRRTIGCLFGLLLIAGAVGGSYVWYLWSRTDEMLHGQIALALRETLPDWKCSFSRARFDFQGQIRIYDFTIQLPNQSQPIVRLPETVISIDRDQLAAQRLVFQQIRLIQPELELLQNADGTWNWQGIDNLPESQGNLPEWIIERGTVRLLIDRGEQQPPAELAVRNAHLQLTPSGKRQYLVKGTVLTEPAGLVSLAGDWHLDHRDWEIKGQIPQMKVTSDVWNKVCEFAPQCRQLIAELPHKLNHPLTGEEVTDPGLNAAGDLYFRLSQQPDVAGIDYKVMFNLTSGQWNHPLLPYPLDNLQGTIHCDPQQVTIPRLSAQHGTFRVDLTKARWNRHGAAYPLTALIRMTDLPLEEPVRSRLSHTLQTAYDHLCPAGKVDALMHVRYAPQTGFQIDSVVQPKSCLISHFKFPYPIEGITGTIRKIGHQVTVDLKGFAGLRAVTVKGKSEIGTETPSTVIDIAVDDLPIDELFIESSPEAVRKTLRGMNLQGLADIRYRLTREGDEEAPWESYLRAQLRSGTMSCKAFPYSINDLQGFLEFEENVWKFTRLQGTHGGTSLTGQGDYRISEGRGILGLTVTAKGAKFDQELELALPEQWKKLWHEFSPQGTFDCVTQLDWIPGGPPPEISFSADLAQTSIQMKSFPFLIDGISGQLSFHRDEANPTLLRADLTDIKGQHEDTQMTLKSGFALLEPDGQWRVRLDELQVEDLTPNNRFRRALPGGFRDIIETLDPRDGNVSLGGMLEFRGTGHAEDGVTSAWDLEILCAGLTVTAGIDLRHLYGQFLTKGTWDGQAISTSGWSDLSSISIMAYQFSNVKGPITINGNQLIIGSRDVVNQQRETEGVARRPAPEQRITGRAIQGVFTLDGIAVLGQETSYRVVLTMRDALLEKYAELYLPNQHDLRGIMTGEAELSGRGNSARNLTGRGQLLIRPAALYQLPVMLAVLKQMNGGSPNNTAFDEAQAFFEIANSCFVFKQVDLKGAALNLRGFGKVYFNRRLSFDFFSTVPRARAPLAILQQVVGQATVGLMGVEVRGTLDNPVAKIRPAQRLDDAFKNFLSGLDPRAPGGGPAPVPVAPSGRRTPIMGGERR